MTIRTFLGGGGGREATVTGEWPDEGALRLAREDPDAFAELYRRYFGRIYRYCYVLTGDAHQAEDATSQAFTNAWAAAHRYRGGNVAAWLLTIARNACVDLVRTRRPEALLDSALDIPDDGQSIEEQALWSEERLRLWTAIEALPPAQRTALTLQLAGWSLSESAVAIGKSEAAVKMLRGRAVQSLRVALEPEVQGNPRSNPSTQGDRDAG